jgi:Tfp pilus assembly protein PilF
MLMKYRALKNDPQNNRSFDEKEFNAWGYGLLQRGESIKAIEVFKLNIELHPKSANAYDSMGEAYMKVENNELAIANYERALELNPALESAKKALLELKK